MTTKKARAKAGAKAKTEADPLAGMTTKKAGAKAGAKAKTEADPLRG